MKDFFSENDCNVTGFITLERANRLLRDRSILMCASPSLPIDSWKVGTDPDSTHIALLINIEPFEKDTAEQFLKDFVAGTGDVNTLYSRAKKLLEGK